MKTKFQIFMWAFIMLALVSCKSTAESQSEESSIETIEFNEEIITATIQPFLVDSPATDYDEDEEEVEEEDADDDDDDDEEDDN